MVFVMLISVCLFYFGYPSLPLIFFCLQELHVLSCAECNSWFSSFGFLSVCSPGSTHSCGTAILYRPKFVLSRSSIDPNGRFVSAEFRFDEISFRVVCLYAPNRNPGRDDFFRYVNDQIDPSVSTFVCGDFNAVFYRTLDRPAPWAFLLPMRVASPLSLCLMTVVWWMFGGLCIQTYLLSLGCAVMGLWLPASILLDVLMPGFTALSLVPLNPARTLIIVPCFLSVPFLLLCLGDLVDGN